MKNPDTLPPEDMMVACLTAGLPQSARTLTGPGDDCAIVRIPGSPLLQLLKADAVVEGIHFTRDMPPAAVGRKALGRAVSDIASMGGLPGEALVTLVLPPDVPWSWVRALYDGLAAAARDWQTGVAGGETSSAPPGAPVMISIALTGSVEESRAIRRCGAQPGDVLAVTGGLGNSFASGWHLNFVPRLQEARWLVTHFPPTAMMDLSDGLAKDLPRLALASGCGWDLDPGRIPLRTGATLEQALGEGEDYELLLAMPEASWTALETQWQQVFPDTALTRIGVMAAAGTMVPELSGGWDHFGRA